MCGLLSKTVTLIITPINAICRPEDFVVTELDSGGQFVTLNNSLDHQQHSVSVDSSTEARGEVGLPTDENKTGIMEEPESSAVQKSVNDGHKSDTTTSPNLEQLVGGDIYQQLVSMLNLLNYMKCH